jgi:hypothetical protein
VVFKDERDLEIDEKATGARRAELAAASNGHSLNDLMPRAEGLLRTPTPVSDAGNKAFGMK